MGLENPIHIAFLLVILLLVFGAKRLPEMGKGLGHGLRGFKEAVSGNDVPAGISAMHETPEATPATPAAQVAPAAPVVVSQPAAEPQLVESAS